MIARALMTRRKLCRDHR